MSLLVYVLNRKHLSLPPTLSMANHQQKLIAWLQKRVQFIICRYLVRALEYIRCSGTAGSTSADHSAGHIIFTAAARKTEQACASSSSQDAPAPVTPATTAPCTTPPLPPRSRSHSQSTAPETAFPKRDAVQHARSAEALDVALDAVPGGCSTERVGKSMQRCLVPTCHRLPRVVVRSLEEGPLRPYATLRQKTVSKMLHQLRILALKCLPEHRFNRP
jgi:hypothetical protein